MINDFMKTLMESVNQKLVNKNELQIKKKAQAIGIRGQKQFNWQRFLFLICQHIAHYIDEHVGIQAKTHSIPFVMAVFIYHNIVDIKYKVWSSVSFIQDMEKLYRQQKKDEILQVFKSNENITILPFERQFSCMCNNKSPQEFSQCEKCLKVFHPACQYQKLVCNKCYLTHYFFPIDWSFYNRFGEKYQTQTYFHSKFKTSNNYENKKIQLIAMEFDINDYADLQNAQQPQLWIKIMNFNDLSHNSQNQKWKNYTNKTSEYSMIMNSNRFEFYINFEPLRRKFLYFRNQNSLIFKLQNRIANEKDNVLMIVCHPDYFQQETYEIGVFRMTKATQNKKFESLQKGQMMSDPFDIDEKSYRINKDQYKLLEKYSENSVQALLKSPIIPAVSNIKKERLKVKQSESSQSESGSVKKQKLELELVRSYGCIHFQGFNYYKMKHYYDGLRKSLMPASKKSEKEKSLNERLAEVKREDRQGAEKKVVKVVKNKGEEIKKEEKKYGKFLKCPICQNHMMSLYLLPYDLKEGEEMRNIHSGIKRKCGQIKSMKLDKSIFEAKKPIFPVHKKEQQDDQNYSEQYRQYHEQSHSDFCTIVQSMSEPLRQNDQKSSENSLYVSSEQQEKVPKYELIQDLEQGEMALNSEQQRECHFQPFQNHFKQAANKIFLKKHEVMSQQSSYSEQQQQQQHKVQTIQQQRVQVQMIQIEQGSNNSNEIIEQQVNQYNGSCQTFQPTGVTYIQDTQRQEKENVIYPNNRSINRHIITVMRNKKQILNQLPQRNVPVVSLLSEDQQESGEMSAGY